MSLVVSPKTGELIKVGSPEFESLVGDPLYRNTFLNPSLDTSSGSVKTVDERPYSPFSPDNSLNDYKMSPLKNMNRVEMKNNTSNRVNIKKKLSPIPFLNRDNNNMNKKDTDMNRENDENNDMNRENDENNDTNNDIKRAEKETEMTTEVPALSSLPLYDIPSLEETLSKTERPSLKKRLKEMLDNDKKGEGRGSKTRGWSARAPHRGKERDQVMEECGSQCFLLPEEKKFPICPSPRLSEDGKAICAVDCGGVQAAKVRASQWKYPEVERKADILLEKCNRKGKEAFTPSVQLPKIPDIEGRQM